jgi:two-component system, OmpR family, phosphate regulon sensor histidine kinase PhoR
MKRRALFTQLAIPLVLVTVVVFGGFSWYAARHVHDLTLSRTRDDLASRAALVEDAMRPLVRSMLVTDVQILARTLGTAAQMRVTIILPDGRVIGDSMEDPARMDNHATRPEIAAALRTGRGEVVRYSHTIDKISLAVARRMGPPEAPMAVVRVSVPTTWVDQAETSIRTQLFTGAAIAVVLVVLVLLIVIRSFVRSVDTVRAGASRFAHGDFDQRIAAPSTRELAEVASDLNTMAAELDARMRTILKQHREQEAMLASMVEGVLAVNGEQRIITVNKALATMLGIDAAQVQGRALEEVIRNSDLQRFAAEALAASVPVESEIVIAGRIEDRHLQAHGTRLPRINGGGEGAVIVLNDITRLRKLENIRREFVSNVSHELKTPVTSIKGFVETLLDGAVDNADDARRFLGIIARQSERLHAIIDDLLSLSRIERDAERHDISREEVHICDVVRAAVQTCELQATERGLHVEIDCDDTVRVRVDPHLVEQALVNLISNAITYSEPGGRIIVSLRSTETDHQISVRDFGTGIAREHLPRLFERFYRVDKARSRTHGGTGLGLAIVKHIAQAHGGTALVDSTPGQGSTFTLVLPIR